MANVSVSRRAFLKSSVLGLLGASTLPAFARRALAQASARGKVFVLLFQRGAADGLSVVPPLGEPRYRSLRPTLALPAKGDGAALDLDGFFGLHPALAPLLPLYNSGSLALLHEVGSPDPTHSHFDANLYAGRDLLVTTDYRAPLSALLHGHLGIADLGSIFPGFTVAPAAWPRLV